MPECGLVRWLITVHSDTIKPMKTVLFVPGFKENYKARDYAAVFRAFERGGFQARFVDINWHRTTQHDWVQQLDEIYKQYHPKDVVLAGFSFGAVTAFLAAAQRVPAGLFLCSLSPLFAEDIAHWTAADRRLVGVCREREARETPFRAAALRINCPVWSCIGSQELDQWPDMRYRFEETKQAFPRGVHTVVSNVGHMVDDERYIAAITRAFQLPDGV